MKRKTCLLIIAILMISVISVVSNGFIVVPKTTIEILPSTNTNTGRATLYAQNMSIVGIMGEIIMPLSSYTTALFGDSTETHMMLRSGVGSLVWTLDSAEGDGVLPDTLFINEHHDSMFGESLWIDWVWTDSSVVTAGDTARTTLTGRVKLIYER